MLTSQISETASALDQTLISIIKLGYVLKIVWGVLSCLTSAFSSQDSTFLTLKQITLYSLIAVFLLTCYQMYMTTAWLKLYQGIDYIYVWYLAFIYLVEIVVMGPLSMFLISAE